MKKFILAILIALINIQYERAMQNDESSQLKKTFEKFIEDESVIKNIFFLKYELITKEYDINDIAKNLLFNKDEKKSENEKNKKILTIIKNNFLLSCIINGKTRDKKYDEIKKFNIDDWFKKKEKTIKELPSILRSNYIYFLNAYNEQADQTYHYEKENLNDALITIKNNFRGQIIFDELVISDQFNAPEKPKTFNALLQDISLEKEKFNNARKSYLFKFNFMIAIFFAGGALLYLGIAKKQANINRTCGFLGVGSLVATCVNYKKYVLGGYNVTHWLRNTAVNMNLCPDYYNFEDLYINLIEKQSYLHSSGAGCDNLKFINRYNLLYPENVPLDRSGHQCGTLNYKKFIDDENNKKMKSILIAMENADNNLMAYALDDIDKKQKIMDYFTKNFHSIEQMLIY